MTYGDIVPQGHRHIHEVEDYVGLLGNIQLFEVVAGGLPTIITHLFAVLLVERLTQELECYLSAADVGLLTIVKNLVERVKILVFPTPGLIFMSHDEVIVSGPITITVIKDAFGR